MRDTRNPVNEENRNAPAVPVVMSLTFTLLRPSTAALSSSSLSSSLESRPLSPFVRMSLPMPIPKLGMRGAMPGRFEPVMNLTLPTCASSASLGRSITSVSIARNLSRIARVVGLFAGSRFMQSSDSCTNSGGHPGLAAPRTSASSIEKYGAARLKWWSSASRRAASSVKMTPSEKMSVGRSNSSPRRISGDMYESVPQNVSRRCSSAFRAAMRAKPKSVIFSRPFAVTSRFSPFRSRWMQRRACRYASARAMSVAKEMRRRHGKGLFLSWI